MSLELVSKLIFVEKGYFQPINGGRQSSKPVLWLRAAEKFSLQIDGTYFGVYKPFFRYWVDVGA
jgi:hypothetical protein